jgi:hypothetical protein
VFSRYEEIAFLVFVLRVKRSIEIVTRIFNSCSGINNILQLHIRRRKSSEWEEITIPSR